MNRFASLSLISFCTVFAACQVKNPKASDSALRLEVDDRFTDESAKLVDVSAAIEAFINNGIDRVRASYGNDKTVIRNNFKEFSAKISAQLSQPRKGSGIAIGGFSIVPYTEAEAWCIENLDPKKFEILTIPIENSRYGNNPVGPYSGRVVSHKLKILADFTVGPVIKIRDTLIGIDKLSHFIEQGFWYYDAGLTQAERFAFGQYMEGDLELATDQHQKYAEIFKSYCHSCNKFGYYGSAASGVISFGDMQANESGYFLYQNLAKDPLNYRFSFADYDYAKWNEVNTPSKFAKGVTAIP